MKKTGVILLTLIISLGLIQTQSVLAETEKNDPITISKSATWKDVEEGIASIELSIHADDVQTTEQKKPVVDVVLVVDLSGSMDEKLDGKKKIDLLKTAAKQLVNQLIDHPNIVARIAVVPFGDGVETGDGYNVLTSDKTLLMDGKKHCFIFCWWEGGINKLAAGNSGTNLQSGISKGNELLNGSNAEHKFMVVLSDGAPTYHYNGTAIVQDHSMADLSNQLANKYNPGYYISSFGSSVKGNGQSLNLSSVYKIGSTEIKNNALPAISAAYIAKKSGIEILSVAFGDINSSNFSDYAEILKGVASQGSDTYFPAGADLSEVFLKLGTIISSVPGASDVSVVDVMGYSKTDGSAYQYDVISESLKVFAKNQSGQTVDVDESVVQASVSKNSEGIDVINWEINGSLNKDLTYYLQYDVKADFSKLTTGTSWTLETNNNAVMSYKDYEGETRSKTFDKPVLTVGQYRIENYFDDVLQTTGEAAPKVIKTGLSTDRSMVVTKPETLSYTVNGTIYRYTEVVPGLGTDITILEDGSTVLKNYYKAGLFGYTVNYYKESIDDSNLLGSEKESIKNGQSFELDYDLYLTDEWLIDSNNYHAYHEGTKLNGDITITVDEDSKIINIIYIRFAYDYTVEYYEDAIHHDNLLDSSKKNVEINQTVNVDTEAFLGSLENSEYYKITYNGTSVSGEISVVIDRAAMKIQIVYVRNSYNYVVEYYRGTIDTENFIDEAEHSITAGETIEVDTTLFYTDDVLGDFKFYAPVYNGSIAPEPLEVVISEDRQVIQIVYVPQNYTIVTNYAKDDVNQVVGSKTYLNQRITDSFTVDLDLFHHEGALGTDYQKYTSQSMGYEDTVNDDGSIVRVYTVLYTKTRYRVTVNYIEKTLSSEETKEQVVEYIDIDGTVSVDLSVWLPENIENYTRLINDSDEVDYLISHDDYVIDVVYTKMSRQVGVWYFKDTTDNEAFVKEWIEVEVDQAVAVDIEKYQSEASLGSNYLHYSGSIVSVDDTDYMEELEDYEYVFVLYTQPIKEYTIRYVNGETNTVINEYKGSGNINQVITIDPDKHLTQEDLGVFYLHFQGVMRMRALSANEYQLSETGDNIIEVVYLKNTYSYQIHYFLGDTLIKTISGVGKAGTEIVFDANAHLTLEALGPDYLDFKVASTTLTNGSHVLVGDYEAEVVYAKKTLANTGDTEDKGDKNKLPNTGVAHHQIWHWLTLLGSIFVTIAWKLKKES